MARTGNPGWACARPAPGSVVHAYHATQFTSWASTNKIRSSGMMPSSGSIGDGLEYAMMESFWSVRANVREPTHPRLNSRPQQVSEAWGRSRESPTRAADPTDRAPCTNSSRRQSYKVIRPPSPPSRDRSMQHCRTDR